MISAALTVDRRHRGNAVGSHAGAELGDVGSCDLIYPAQIEDVIAALVSRGVCPTRLRRLIETTG